MKNFRRVVWSRGMFLTPQHFQKQDHFLDEILQFRFTASHFANWGVVNLDIDQDALTNGLFTLRSCRGVLPDGLVFSIPDPDPVPPGRPIADNFPPNQDGLDVYLALPEHRPAGKNFSQAAGPVGGVTTRYVAETIEVEDENGYGESKSVQVASKNFSLLYGNQNLDGFVKMRIARVVRKAGAYVLDPAFIAPCLSIASSAYLMKLLRSHLEILISNADSLSANRRQPGQPLVDTFLVLHTLNSFIPELQHIYDIQRGHPEGLWIALLRLAGALATFSKDSNAHDFPQYNHDNLGLCFTLLDEKLQSLLDVQIDRKCISIPLRHVEPSLWTGTVSSGDYFKNSSFFLAVNARVGVDELVSKVPQLVKVSPPEEMQNLIRLALPGITLRHTTALPSTISFKANNQYFTLNQTGRLWERIVQSRNISLLIPGELAEAQPELLVVLP